MVSSHSDVALPGTDVGIIVHDLLSICSSPFASFGTGLMKWWDQGKVAVAGLLSSQPMAKALLLPHGAHMKAAQH